MTNISEYLTAAHLFGYLAFIVSMAQMQFKSQRTFFGVNIASDMLWLMHYVLLGGITPAISLGISLTRTLLAVFLLQNHRGLISVVSFLCLAALCVIYNVDGAVGYLPVLAAAIFSAIAYYNKHYLATRLLTILGFVCWIVIGAFYGSMIEIVSSGIGILSILIGMTRHYWRKPSGNLN